MWRPHLSRFVHTPQMVPMYTGVSMPEPPIDAGHLECSDMHELALADSVVKAALRAAEDSGIERIERVIVKVGELQAIERDLFEFSLTNVLPAQDARLEGVEFDVIEEKVRFRCRPCGREYGRSDVDIDADGDQGEAVHFIPELSHAYARCPECGSPDFDITQGRGIILERIMGLGSAQDES